MPDQLMLRMKWWGYALCKCVAMYRNLTGTTRGAGILAFVFANGFKQQ